MSRKNAGFESIEARTEVKAGSERSFGIIFAAVFVIIGLWPLLDGTSPRLWALGIGTAFLLVAAIAPAVLRPLNQLWFRFGLLLHRVVTPLIMGFIFFLTITPIAIIFRLMGKDPLHRRFDAAAQSYWHRRDPSGPAPETMKNQF